MPLTPADVHNVAFKKPPIGKRGYDEDEVDEFLDLVESELARLIEENNDLRGRVDELQRRAGATVDVREPGPPPRPPVEPQPAGPPQEARMHVQPEPPAVVGRDDHIAAVNVLAMAQQTADHHVNEAKAEADRIRHEARSEIERLVGEARTKADALAGDARNRAEALERDARAKAAALTAEAERRHNEVMGSLEMKKADLEKAIGGLRAFEREYRTRLRSYLESQLRDLDSRGSAEPSSAPASVAAGGARVVNAGVGQPGGSRSYGGPSMAPAGRHDDAASPAGQHSHG